MFQQLIEYLKKNPKRIVFTEGADPRILEAASRLLAGTFLKPVLIGDPVEVQKAAEDAGYNIRGAEIEDPNNSAYMDEMVEIFCELRKSKGVTPEDARKTLAQGNYFGTMMVKMGKADALLGGATYSTADTVRPALQIIKTKPGHSIVSSCFILVRPSATGENEVLAMGDCAINIKPTAEELSEIAVEVAECGKIFGIDPKVAFLSYSTLGSGKGEDVDKMRRAMELTRERAPACLWTASCSSTPPSPHASPRPSARAALWPVMPTPSFSPTSTRATSAIRLPSVWASSTPTGPSSWA